MKMVLGIFAVIALASVFTLAQTKKVQPKPESAPKPEVKQRLSDDYAKTAIKYVIALQNFELNATSGPKVAAEARTETAKEDMEAAETQFGCDSHFATIAPTFCPEPTTTRLLEIQGVYHTVSVEAYHSGFTLAEKADMGKSYACLDALKTALQKRSTVEDACREDKSMPKAADLDPNAVIKQGECLRAAQNADDRQACMSMKITK